MQGRYEARFEREMGCTEAEWLQWLPHAAGSTALQVGDGTARVAVAAGTLSLRWRVLPPRAIALLRLPRLHVAFDFDGVEDDARHAFMRRFDLFTQRGGG